MEELLIERDAKTKQYNKCVNMAKFFIENIFLWPLFYYLFAYFITYGLTLIIIGYVFLGFMGASLITSLVFSILALKNKKELKKVIDKILIEDEFEQQIPEELKAERKQVIDKFNKLKVWHTITRIAVGVFFAVMLCLSFYFPGQASKNFLLYVFSCVFTYGTIALFAINMFVGSVHKNAYIGVMKVDKKLKEFRQSLENPEPTENLEQIENKEDDIFGF